MTTTQRFFGNEHFLAYVRLLHQLHVLIREHADETPRGEAVRDQMDEPANYLASDEVDCLNAISADLYTLSGPPWQIQLGSPAVHKELAEMLEARDRRDFVRALDLLRKNQAYRDAATMSFMRGRIWSMAGENEIAVDFFRRAKELAPENGNYGFMWLNILWQVKADEALTTAKAILQQAADNPPHLVLKAADIVFASTRQRPSNEEKMIVRELIPIFEDVVMRLQASGEAESNPSFLANTIGLLGLCLARLGDTTQAIKCLDKGLQLVPNSDTLLTVRGIQRYGINGIDTQHSVEDFRLAIRLRSHLVWPYFFLAHHYLLHDQYQESLEHAYQALRLTISAPLQADCLEWIAICQAALRLPPETVRAAFHAALQLAPDNQRIKTNLQLFEKSMASSIPAQVPWEQVTPGTVRSLGQQEFRLAA